LTGEANGGLKLPCHWLISTPLAPKNGYAGFWRHAGMASLQWQRRWSIVQRVLVPGSSLSSQSTAAHLKP